MKGVSLAAATCTLGLLLVDSPTQASTIGTTSDYPGYSARGILIRSLHYKL
jgi:hypothetical protein